ncbi:uncharacterized protein VTP21DRAFT_5599 [Calcarisporiella thermophila]|uniref:uncharacterized protein n=1 Tax=Calcarisporiella thermophila TaxID=911321 RepID=UPI00374375BB
MRFTPSLIGTASRVGSTFAANTRLHGSMAYRQFSSGTPPPPRKSNPLLTIGGPVALLAAGYYYYSKKSGQPVTEVAKEAVKATETPVKKALNPEEFTPFKLREVHDVNYNTKLFRFDLPEQDQVLGLHVASCVLTRFPQENGKYVVRPYTPTSDEDQKGFFDLIIKKYKDGPMSEHIHAMKPGDVLEVKGPIPKYPYEANKHEEVGLIAGGTGITPMLQLISAILKDPKDKTKITLLFANVTEDDILLRSEFDRLAKEKPNQFKVVYTLDKPPKDWQGETGFVSEDMVKKHMPAPAEGKSMLFVCGPNGMLQHVCGMKGPNFTQGEVTGVLGKLGYSSNTVYKF